MGERSRVIIRCTECKATHTGYAWDDRPPKIVGKEGCPSCGAEEFEVVEVTENEEASSK